MKRPVAGRYELIELLGRGGYGEVWKARDTLSDRVVAVKLLRPDVDFSRVQGEVAALRQRLPGVVELYDDGVEDGLPYLVMELVDGKHFPGQDRPCAWTDIADLTAALLETLVHVHAAFVVHRDLKPENVLVTPERQIKVLDFGLAYRTDAMALRLTQRPEIIGTRGYMAPEQVRGLAYERSDLYAVGVMLYEALVGCRPHDDDAVTAKKQLPVPLAQAAPGVPPRVASLVDDLLAYEPEARPRSALDVLQRLRGEPSVAAPHFPWLGPQDTPRALVDAVRAGRSVDLVGPRGSGRTRCLRALAQALGDARHLVLLPRGEDPFESLSPIVGTLRDQPQAPLAEVRAVVEDGVRRALATGDAVVADDAELLDDDSLSVLEACRDAGPIVRVFCSAAARAPRGAADAGDDADVLTLSPLREEHLRGLFAGPDRLLHLREDAARVLHLRTKGMPGRITEEVTSWVRLGVARWTRNLLVVDRAAIENLESGLVVAAPIDLDPAGIEGISGALLDLLAWLTLAWPHGDAALIASASGEPRFRVDAHLAELERGGLVERGADGRILPRVTSWTQRWTEGRIRAAHAALARHLPKGTPGRLAHLWLRGARSHDERREIAEEAAATAGRQIDQGRLASAMVTVETGIRSVRELGPLAFPEIARLLSLWVEAAVQSHLPRALDRVLYEICRTEPRTALVEQLEALCRAALAIREFTDRPLEHIEKVPPFEDPRLERSRLDVYAKAARHLSDAREQEAVLRRLTSCVPVSDADAEATLDDFWGRLRYHQGRFLEAVELHRAAANKATNAILRAYSTNCGAFACMDAFAFEEARTLATRAREDAHALRHAYHETWAEWVLRSVAYRLDEAGEPDVELVEAAAFVGVPQVQGVILLNEAAVAWRRRDRVWAVQLADQAHGTLSAVHEPGSALLARSLAVAAGSGASDDEITDLCKGALDRLMPGIGLQALALLALSGRLPPHCVPADRIAALCDEVPLEHRDKRMDVLSANECLAALGPLTGSSAAGTER